MQLNKKIIVVDDDPDIHDFIDVSLKKTGFAIDHAYTVEEAIDLLKTNPYTYGLFDIILSSSASSQAIIEFIETKEAGVNQHLPLCIMSSHMDEKFSQNVKLKTANVIATLHKPYKPQNLRQVFEGHPEQSILLLEDDPDMARLIKKELEQNYYSVYSVRTNEKAMELLSATKFLCAIVDNNLGVDTSSQKLFDFLKTDGRDFELPIILTGTKIREDIAEDPKLFVFEKVKKPYKKSSFTKTINQLLSWSVNAHKKKFEDSLTSDNSFSDMISLVAESEIDYHNEQIQKISPFEEDLGPDHQVVKGSKQQVDEDGYIVISKKELINTNEKWQVKSLGVDSGENKEPTYSKATLANQRDKSGLTPAMIAAQKGDMPTLQQLIKDGANLGFRTKDGKTVLHYAALSPNAKVISFLVDHGLKVNERDQKNCEPLYYAISAQNLATTEAFIEVGARLNARVKGMTYLTVAVLTGNYQLTKVIMEQNINPTLKDHQGKSSIDYARLKKYKDIYQLLQSGV